MKSKPFNVIQAVLDNLIPTIIVAITGIIIVLVVSVSTHKSYFTVSSSILFEQDPQELVYATKENISLSSFENWMRTQVHEIESSKVLKNAIADFEKSGYKWKYPDESHKISIDRLRGRLAINLVNNTHMMTVSIGGRNKKGLAEIVNHVVNNYITVQNEKRQEQDQDKLHYLRDEREKYNTRLDSAYNELMDISQQYSTAIADEKNLHIYLNMFMDLRSRYNKVLTGRIESNNKLEALLNQKNSLKDLDIYDLGNTQLLHEMELEIKSRMIGLKPGNPEYHHFLEMLSEINKSNIETARKYLISEIDKEISQQNMFLESARNTEIDLKLELDKVQDEVMEFNSAVLQTSTQRQEIDRIINIWNRINERIEQIEIELFNPGRIHVLNPAQPPELPDPHKLIKKIILGIIAVLGLSIAFTLIKEKLDDRIKRTADIEDVLGFPASGFLIDKKIENISHEDMFAVYSLNPDSYMAELYKFITIRIEKDHNSHGSKIFAAFSLIGDSGVTSSCTNLLGLIDADKNEKLLIDLNIQKRNTIIESDSKGINTLTDYLSGKEDLSNCIHKSSDNPFDVLLLGDIHSIGINKLRSSVIQNILSKLKTRYKYIIIDAPPILTSSDAHTIAQIADVSLLILDAQKDTWQELIRSAKILDSLKVKVVSVILNKVKVMRAGYIRNSVQEYRDIRSSIIPPSEHVTSENAIG